MRKSAGKLTVRVGGYHAAKVTHTAGDGRRYLLAWAEKSGATVTFANRAVKIVARDETRTFPASILKLGLSAVMAEVRGIHHAGGCLSKPGRHQR